MKFTHVNNLSEFLYGSRIIGVGTTAVCFLMSDNRVLKVYRNTYLKRQLFELKNMKEHLKLLNKITNDSYIGPDEVLLKNNEVIAYIYPYINSKTLSKISNGVTIYDLCENFDKLIDDTEKVSNYSFRLGDLHSKNILFNLYYHLIDLDKGYIEKDKDKSEINRENIRDITKTIIYSLFNIKYNEEICFYDKNLNDLYCSVIYYNQAKLKDLLEEIIKIYNIENPKKKTLVNKRYKILKITENDYYSYLM